MLIKLSKKKLFLLLPILCMILFYQSSSASDAILVNAGQFRINKQSQKLNQPSTKNMMNTIKALSTESREYSKSSENKACNYLKNKFKAYGYTPYIQKISHRGMTGLISRSQNLIATKKSTAKVRKGIIVICAHYDCDKDSLGANDDASGCAVVLEEARLLKTEQSAYEFRFVLFGGEEAGCIGSEDYVLKLSENDKRNMKAAIDIDSIAQKDYVKPRIFTVSGKKNSATEILRSAEENKKLTISKMIRERSDYTMFDYYVMPALCIGQPYTNKLKINKDKDSISHIDKSLLGYVANIIFKALRQA